MYSVLEVVVVLPFASVVTVVVVTLPSALVTTVVVVPALPVVEVPPVVPLLPPVVPLLPPPVVVVPPPPVVVSPFPGYLPMTGSTADYRPFEWVISMAPFKAP